MAIGKTSSRRFGGAVIFGILFGLVAIAAVVSIIVNVNRESGPDVLTTETDTHPHVFGYAPDGTSVWIGTHTGIYGFADGQWIRTVEPLSNSDVMGYFVNAQQPNTVYVSGHGFVQRSTDGGGTWNAIENGMPNAPKPDVPDAHLMAQDPHDPSHLFVFLAQPQNNIYETLDGGDTWKLAGTVSPEAFSLAAAPEGGSAVLLGTPTGLIHYSFAAGETSSTAWTTEPTYHVLTRSNGETIALTPKGFLRSTDGNAWATMEIDTDGEQPLGIRASHADPNRLAVVTAEYSLFESVDGGLTWEKQ